MSSKDAVYVELRCCGWLLMVVGAWAVAGTCDSTWQYVPALAGLVVAELGASVTRGVAAARGRR